MNKTRHQIVNIANVFVAIMLIVAVVFCLAFAYYEISGKERAVFDFDGAVEVAKEDFGCDKILWVGNATPYSELLKDDENIERYGHYGAYVLGVKHSEEILIYIPFRTTERKARVIDWPFCYSLSDIISKLAIYGYNNTQSAASINKGSYLKSLDNEYDIKRCVKNFREPTAFYDSLDVKMIFTFYEKYSAEVFYDYYVTQECGKIKLYRRENYGSDAVERIILSA